MTFISLAFAWSVLIVVLALVDHDRGSPSDPNQVFHSYTLVHDVAPGILGLVGAPMVISLVVALLLHLKTARRSLRAARAAAFCAGLTCFICLVGLLIEGIVMVPAGALTVCAVATAPLPPDPDDRLVRSAGALHRLPPRA